MLEGILDNIHSAILKHIFMMDPKTAPDSTDLDDNVSDNYSDNSD